MYDHTSNPVIKGRIERAILKFSKFADRNPGLAIEVAGFFDETSTRGTERKNPTAAERIGAAFQGPDETMPEGLKDWAEKHPDAAVGLAISLAKGRTETDAEYLSRWAEEHPGAAKSLAERVMKEPDGVDFRNMALWPRPIWRMNRGL